ncbi:hypothetical protein ACF0H5_017890 [Mactra antiquata]
MSVESIIQPPPFGSTEEADEFIRNHELSENQKFFIKRKRTHNSPDVACVSKCNIRWDFNLASGVYCDGIPYMIIADQIRVCQYGPPKKQEDAPDSDEEENWRKRKKRVNKKVNCPAKIWTKTIMKFPEYKADVFDGGVRKCDRKRLSMKLKREFDDETQRFLMVFVQILNTHDHEGLNGNTTVTEDWTTLEDSTTVDGLTPNTPDNSMDMKTPKRTPVKKSVMKPYGKRMRFSDSKPKGQILKRGATLRGRNLMKLALEFKDADDQIPFPLAQPRMNKTLESMTELELVTLYHDLTGEVPNEIFAVSNKDYCQDSLIILLHLCICAANALIENDYEDSVHPSIRIKGTEHIFTPVVCEAIDCVSIGDHMHCPLCSCCEAYTDSTLLKKHFTQKHLQNSIEFSGLKILRCLDSCEVEGNKNKQDGHWHCWKCKLCHSKRVSCLKHFMGHLKNSEPIVQVEILQNVNLCVKSGHITHDINCLLAFNSIAHEIALETGETSAEITQTFKKLAQSSDPGVPKKHHYVVSQGDGHGLIHNEQQNAVMYIQDDNIASLLTLGQDGEVVLGYNDETDIDRLRCVIRELEQKCTSLEKTNMIQKSRIQFLTEKTESQEKAMSELNMKYQDLLTRYESMEKTDQPETIGGGSNNEEDTAVGSITEEESSTSTADNTKIDTPIDTLGESTSKGPFRHDLFKQSLEGLKSHMKQKRTKMTEASEDDTDGLNDIKNHLSSIKKDIEQLKIAALLTNQQSQSNIVGGSPMFSGLNVSNVNNASQNLAMMLEGKTLSLSNGGGQSPNVSSLGSKFTVNSPSACPKQQKSTPANKIMTVHKLVKKTGEAANDASDDTSGKKMVLTKKNNTVVVALKPGSTASLSRGEIEELVNSAVKKMGHDKE